MPLFELYEFAKSQGKSKGLIDPGFGPKKIAFTLIYNQSGGLARIEKNPNNFTLTAPVRMGRTNNALDVEWMADKAAKMIPGFTDKARDAASFSEMLRLTELAAEATGDPMVKQCLDFVRKLSVDASAVISELKELGCTDSSIITFTPRASVPRIASIVQLDSVKQWWSAYLDTLLAEGGFVGTCLLTKRVTTLARVHDKLIGNAKLASYDNQAYDHWGNEQGMNFPIGIDVASGYAAAFKYMCSREAGDLYHYDVKRSKKQKLETTSRFVFWSSAKVLEKLHGILSDASTDPDIVKTALAKLKPMKAERFCLLHVNMPETSGTLMLNSFMDIDSSSLMQNLEVWREKLAFVTGPLWQKRYDKKEESYKILSKTGEMAKTPFLNEILYSISPQSESESGGTVRRFNPPIGAQFNLFLDAILCRKINIRWLATAIHETVLAKGETVRAKTSYDGPETYNVARFCLLKAAYNDNRKGGKKVMASIDLENREVPYLLGRFFAICELIRKRKIETSGQNKEKGDGGYFSSYLRPFLSSPLGTYVRTKATASTDLSQLRSRGVNTVYYQKFFSEIENDLLAVPSRFNVTEQALFLLGNIHQKTQHYSTKEKKDNE